MDLEYQDWGVYFFLPNEINMEEVLAQEPPTMQGDSNEMNLNSMAVNLDDIGVSVAPAEPGTLLDNRPEKKQETSNNVVSNGGRHGRWLDDEHQRFLLGLNIHGKGRWKKIADLVGTRTSSQVASHAQKFFQRQRLLDKKRSSINDSSVNLNSNKCHPDTPESSSLAVLQHSVRPAYVIAPQYIPAQRSPDNVLEGERNFGGSIQPQHLEEQYYPTVMMQLPAPQHHPAQWNTNNFSGGGNIWPVRSPSTELPYYPVTAQMFPWQ